MLAEKIINRILNHLDESTWKDENFTGYNQLLDYKEDMVEDTLYVLEHFKQRKG